MTKNWTSITLKKEPRKSKSAALITHTLRPYWINTEHIRVCVFLLTRTAEPSLIVNRIICGGEIHPFRCIQVLVQVVFHKFWINVLPIDYCYLHLLILQPRRYLNYQLSNFPKKIEKIVFISSVRNNPRLQNDYHTAFRERESALES